MWHLFQGSLCTASRQRFSTPKLYSKILTNVKENIPKPKFRHLIRNTECLKRSSKHNLTLLCSPWKVCSGLSIGFGIRHLLGKHIVLCTEHGRVIQRRPNHNKDSSKFNWHLFFEYLKPHKLLLIAAIGSALVVAALNIMIPQMLGAIVNILNNLKNDPQLDFMTEIRLPALKMLSLYMGQAFFTFLYIHLLSIVGERVACHMKQDLFRSIMAQDIAFFDVERTGELVNRITVDVQDFKSSFKQTVSLGLRAVAQVIGSAASLLIISPQLTGLTLVCIPSVVIGGTCIGSLLRNLSREAQSQVEKATLVAEEAISNVRTVRAFAGEENECQRFGKECKRVCELNTELGLGIGLFQAGTNLFLNGMVLGTMFVGGHLMSCGQLSAGDVMAFLVNVQTMQRSVAQLSLLFGSVMKGISAGGRVFEYIYKKPLMDRSGKKIIKYHEFVGDVEFKNVKFIYPSRPESVVLNNFNLRIPAGKTVAIVGSSGNGKSTVVALLERLYDVNEGSVSIDGKDIRELKADWLRGRLIGLISQEPVLFATTIKENIRYGKPDATDEEVIKAAKIANAHEFVTGFPDGYDTMVGERGVSLSGGQKQRVAIARAVLKDPPILILDEATSALDSASEKTVQMALEEASRGRTVLVIAHRLSTVKDADVIVVLHKGSVVEMGTHETLKKLKGHYWNLVKRQEELTKSASKS